MIYLGIDLHQRFAQVAGMNSKGKVLFQKKVSTDKESTQQFLKEKICLPAKAAIESTTNWYYYYQLLESYGIEVHLAHPLKTRVIAEAKLKNDKVDALMLAHLLRTNLLPTSYIPSKKIREQRELLRTRIKLVRTGTMIKNRIHSILIKNGIINQYSDLFGRKAKEFLDNLNLEDVFRKELDDLLDILTYLQQKIEWYSQEILRQAKLDKEVLIISSIPGLSYYSGLLVKTEIGDFRRFNTASRLCSYAGIIPRSHDSGERVRRGRITKQGSAYLRWILTEAATHAQRNQGNIGKFFKRIEKKKGKKIARIATARKLLSIAYHLVLKQEMFSDTELIIKRKSFKSKEVIFNST